eukprot:1166698-Amorphochlora_amoeboformis.AAC.3
MSAVYFRQDKAQNGIKTKRKESDRGSWGCRCKMTSEEAYATVLKDSKYSHLGTAIQSPSIHHQPINRETSMNEATRQPPMS